MMNTRADNKILLLQCIMPRFFSILIVFLFGSCQGKQKDNAIIQKINDSPNYLTETKSLPVNSLGYYKADGDSLIIPTFEIGVNLSPKADKKLKEDKETIIVAAFFSGQPKNKTSKEYLNDGEIFLTSAKIELTDARIAKFEGTKFSKTLYDSLDDKDIQLLINIYSGRKSSQDNLLDGGLLSVKMSKVKGKSWPMKVKLIYNDD
jgi:hypothetical protein